MAVTTKKPKVVSVIKTDEFLQKYFDVTIGDEYKVVSEGKQESLKYGYRINTKNDRAIILYDNEVTVNLVSDGDSN